MCLGCIMAKPREYTHASPLLSPVSNSVIYFVQGSQINPAINQSVLFPLRDQVRQCLACLYVNYCKLSILFPHMRCNKALYIRHKT